MTTVFLSGSRHLHRLNDSIRLRIQNILKQNFNIVIGDANGADKAMQSYIYDCNYTNVFVFFAGDTYRNNIGLWETKQIIPKTKITGKALYTERDKAMAKQADFGFALWDGKSEGTINNILELLKQNKKSVLYLSSNKEFFNIKTPEDFISLIKLYKPEFLQNLRNSNYLQKQTQLLNISEQSNFL